MDITINGQIHKFDTTLNITDLLKHLNVSNKMIVIELNLNIVNKEDYDKTYFKENDSIEIVSFVGGG